MNESFSVIMDGKKREGEGEGEADAGEHPCQGVGGRDFPFHLDPFHGRSREVGENDLHTVCQELRETVDHGELFEDDLRCMEGSEESDSSPSDR